MVKIYEAAQAKKNQIIFSILMAAWYKTIKALLTNGAFVAIKHDKELQMFYHQKIQKGKAKMSVINIIRNKIVSRAFAAVKRGTPYVSTQKYA